jgi:hypothetical protein
MRIFIFSIVFVLLAGLNGYSQKPDSSKINYKPIVFGILKTKTEYDLENTKIRFEVRNARFGAKGNINPLFAYKVEIDLSDEGKIKMLDAYVKFNPLKGLDFYMGQRKIPFSTDYMRNPAENIFANRSFVSKYINDGMRDIGFYANYKLTGKIPIDLLIGAVNGTGNNNPQWIEMANLVGRITAGKDNGFRVASNIYYGEAQNRTKLTMLDQEIRYSVGSLFIESEYTYRMWTDTASVRRHDDGFYIHSFYNIRLKKEMVKLITPTVRWDWMRPFYPDGNGDANRLTLGLNVGFEPKQFTAEIRFNYEKYMKSSLPSHVDKMTIEFIAVF